MSGNHKEEEKVISLRKENDTEEVSKIRSVENLSRLAISLLRWETGDHSKGENPVKPAARITALSSLSTGCTGKPPLNLRKGRADEEDIGTANVQSFPGSRGNAPPQKT